MIEYQVRDAAPISFFTMIPHLIDDSDLSAQAIRLYLHLKRVTGESGQCWQTQDTIERECRMSNRTVVKAKRELIQAGFIEITLQPINQHPGHLITIVDLWERNEEVYRCKTAPDSGVKEHPIAVQKSTSMNTHPVDPSKQPHKGIEGNKNGVAKIFETMRAYLGFPERVKIDPIPSYGPEGQAIKRLLTRGYSPEEILVYWKSRVDKAGGFVSMVYINKDIGAPAAGRAGGKRVKVPDAAALDAEARALGLTT